MSKKSALRGANEALTVRMSNITYGRQNWQGLVSFRLNEKTETGLFWKDTVGEPLKGDDIKKN